MKFYFLLLILPFISCSSGGSEPTEGVEVDTLAINEVKEETEIAVEPVETPRLFSIYQLQEDPNEEPRRYTGVVVLTDYFRWYYDERDSVYVDPEFRYESKPKDNYHELKGFRRDRFLDSAHIEESDSLFMMHPQLGELGKYRVGDLKLVAFVNVYESHREVGNEANYAPWSFHIGLELPSYPTEKINRSMHSAIGSITQTDPFVSDFRFEPIMWKEGAPIDTSVFDSTMLHRWSISDSTSITYRYTYEDLELILADRYYKDTGRRGVRFHLTSRFLIARNTVTDQVVYRGVFREGESASSTPLYMVNGEGKSEALHYIGYLLRGHAPVILNMQWFSFGCPQAVELDEEGKRLWLECDNRH